MDTTKEYINMRRKAKEIPGPEPRTLHKYWGHLPFDLWLDEHFIDSEGNYFFGQWKRRGKDGQMLYRKMICLLKQDQLQEMVRRYEDDSGIRDTQGIIEHLAGNIFNHADVSCGVDSYYRQFKSMEQLWHAFVMYQNHGKIWNGEDWIKEELPKLKLAVDINELVMTRED